MKRTVLVALCVALFAISAASPSAAQATRPGDAHYEAVAGAPVAEAFVRDVVAFVEWARAVEFVSAVQLNQAVLFVLAAERAALEAYEAQLARERSAVTSRSSSGGGGGGSCYASQVPAGIIDRESKGDPTVWNTEGSGAWGCFQFMPGTWASSCSDLGVHGQASVSAQVACADRVWAGGAGASHWR